MRKVKIKNLREALESRDKQIALEYVKYGGSLRQFAIAQEIELTLAFRAVKRWSDWARAEVSTKENQNNNGKS